MVETIPFVFEVQSSDQEKSCKDTHEHEVPFFRFF
jgi:hypothetical protein